MSLVPRLVLGLAACLTLARPGCVFGQSPEGTFHQASSRWFFETSVGSIWLVETRRAFDGGATLGIGVGYLLSPSTAVRLTLAGEALHYRHERLRELFDDAEPAEAESLGSEIGRISAGIEWSPADAGMLRPLLGLALGYEHLEAPLLLTTRLWSRCSFATQFIWSTDPETSRSTLTTTNSVPEAGCTGLRGDLAEANRVTLGGSTGLILHVGRGAVSASVEYRHGLPSVAEGVVAARASFRLHF